VLSARQVVLSAWRPFSLQMPGPALAAPEQVAGVAVGSTSHWFQLAHVIEFKPSPSDVSIC
jgi:hypothetical protein